jgi:hypothetical protein
MIKTTAKIKQRLTWRQELRDGAPYLFGVTITVFAVLIEQFHLPHMWFAIGLPVLIFVGLPAFMVLTDERKR